MSYQTAYRSRYRRHRRRRRNSHWGVLIALILVIVIAIPVAFHIVKGISGAIFGGSQNQLVLQMNNGKALLGDDVVDLGSAAPFRDQNGNAYVPVKPVCDNLEFSLTWDQATKTITVSDNKLTVQAQIDSTSLRVNEAAQTMALVPRLSDGTAYVPAKEFCRALSLQVNDLGSGQGDLVVLTKSKKELKEDKLNEIAEKALEKLGPSQQTLQQTSVLMRVGSDKLVRGGQSAQMVQDGERLGAAVIEQDGLRYVPLKAAITTLGGTAEFEREAEWTINYDGIQSTVRDNAKTKVGGDRVKGDDIKVHTDENGRFYVSAPLFAALVGRNYTDLADEEGTFAFTKGSLEGFDSQKAYLDTMKSALTDAVGGDIPEADVYVALTFDDGPTGATDTYPNGYTATLLEELKKRNVHATFFMCGYRIKDFHSHMEQYLAAGHELGNHTMTHPMSRLTHLDAATVRDEVESNSELIESYTGQKPTVMRPVGGGVNDTVKEQMKALGLPIINWSVDTLDWSTKTDPESVKDHIINEVEDGDIVLMHDIWQGTLPGVLAAIDELQSRTDKTYAFVTVSELAAVKGITLEPGMVYSNLSDATVQAIEDGTYKENIFD